MRRLLAAMSLAAVAVLGACTDVTSPGQVYGTYTLRTVNGYTLPVTVRNDYYERDDLIAGNLILRSDYTWDGTLSYEVYPSGGSAYRDDEPVSGTFDQNGNAIVLHYYDGTPDDNGSLVNGTLTLVEPSSNVTLVFSRQ